MSLSFFNPENLPLPDLGDGQGYRPLTVEEWAMLSDRDCIGTTTHTVLFETLKPELYSTGAARWIPASPVKPLSKVITYRTLAPTPPPWTALPHPLIPVDREECEEVHAAAEGDFVEAWTWLAAYHHQIMVSKGFWRGEDAVMEALKDQPELAATVQAAFDGQKIALQGSELSEALEALRHGNKPDDKIPEYPGSAAELADVVLRIMDHAHKRGWNVAGAIVTKLRMNATRAAMHGGKQF